LASKLIELAERVKVIKSKVDNKIIQRKKEDALQRISNYIAKYVEILGVENYENPVQLDIDNLTLKVSSARGREDYLWEIGSAANWMGYHIASLLALHQHFLSVPNNPVPHFIIFDQPSQAYFPDPEELPDGADIAKALKEGATTKKGSDIIRTHNIFKALLMAFTICRKEIQIIVLEHAGELYWEGIQDIVVVKNWHNENDALIPKEWLS
jgi:hypothetical protein